MSNYHVGIFISRISIAFVAIFILLGFHSPPTFADTLGEDNTYDIILEVKRDRKTLATAIFGLDKEGKYYVPIQELARIVSFNAKTDLETGAVSGFFISEENSYIIDTQKNTYTLRGNSYEFDPQEAFVFSQQLGIGDIYVTPDLLNKIWPLDLALDPLKQVLDIQSAKKLPYELSIARQRKRNSRLNRLEQQDHTDLDLPRIDNSYKTFSLPALDFTSTTRFGGSDGGIGQNINIRGGNDLFKTQANYNFSFDKEQSGSFKFTNARLLMERKSYEEGDLPAGLQLMQFGDVRPRPSRLIDGALVGRGILLSSEPQKQIRDFDQITVEGTAEPGWEVELYRGNELIDYQVVNNQGEYRFENVTLNYSNTIIKTVLYGPEGQVKEVEENYNISDAMLRPGKNIFEASILDLNRDLIPTDNDIKNQPKGLAQNYKFKRGINSWLSAFATLTSMPTIDKTRNYATMGTNLSFMGISGLAEVYKDLSGGTAYDVRAATTFQGANLNLRSSFYSGFESEEARFDDAARKSRTEFSLSKPFQTFLGTLGLRFKLNHERFVKNPDRTEFDFSQTFAKNGLRITHGNTFNISDRSYQNADGRINATYRLNTHWTLRSLLNYDIYPDSHIRNLLSELRYRSGSKFTAAFDIDRSFQNAGTRFGAEASYDFEKFRAGFNTDWDRDSGLRAFLRATFSMAPYGQNSDYIFSSKNLSNRGALNANVYLDKNYNGQFDEGDESIQDAKVDIGRRETNLSDENGYASYTGSPKDEYENITLNMDSLNNPFTISGKEGYSAVLRPGTVVNTDFPVFETGVIEGEVMADTGPLSGVRIEMLSEGKVIDTTSSAFDGYYVFEYVEPGDYVVRIDPTYEQVHVQPKSVSVTSENLFPDGVDFQISEQADEVACTEGKDDDGRITQDCQISSIPSGTEQSAHADSVKSEDFPTVGNLRFFQKGDSLEMVLDYNKQPNDFQIARTKDESEITLTFPQTQWNLKKSWKNKTPKILEGYKVETLPNGDTKLILKAVDKIKIKESNMLEPDKEFGNRIAFSLVK